MTTTTRSIGEIAIEIRKTWKNVSFGAAPYLDAMRYLNTVNDMYYHDTAKSILNYFLANASTFRGEDAKRIKLEIKAMLK